MSGSHAATEGGGGSYEDWSGGRENKRKKTLKTFWETAVTVSNKMSRQWLSYLIVQHRHSNIE